MNTWPATLPQKFLTDGFSDEEPDLVLQTQMDAPYQKSRRRFTAGVRNFTGKIYLSFEGGNDQLSTFRDFYSENCAIPFLFPDPYTGTNTSCVFLKPVPQYGASEGPYVIVTFKIGQLP